MPMGSAGQGEGAGGDGGSEKVWAAERGAGKGRESVRGDLQMATMIMQNMVIFS